MNDSTMHLHPDALFVVACPVCQGQVAATGSLCGRDACCPLCANLFQVPFPPAAAADSPREAAAPPSAPGPASLGEDWGGVIEKLAPPRRQLPADEVALREPARTVHVGGEVIEIRRLSPEERRARRIRRNLLLIVVGVSILLAIVVLAGFRG